MVDRKEDPCYTRTPPICLVTPFNQLYMKNARLMKIGSPDRVSTTISQVIGLQCLLISNAYTSENTLFLYTAKEEQKESMWNCEIWLVEEQGSAENVHTLCAVAHMGLACK